MHPRDVLRSAGRGGVLGVVVVVAVVVAVALVGVCALLSAAVARLSRSTGPVLRGAGGG